MTQSISRRHFLVAAGTVAAAGTAAKAGANAEPAAPLKIIGVACSPRKGKTTAAALTICLDAAKAVDPKRIEIELVELADLEIPAYVAAKVPLKAGHKDDFPAVAAKLTDPQVAGIVIGTPVHFGSLSALCKSFLDRIMDVRKPKRALENKAGGALAVGGCRSGGQELAIQCIHVAMFRHDVLIVGDGQPCHTGASLWNNGKDDISQDEIGKGTAVSLGRRMAEVILARSEPAR